MTFYQKIGAIGKRFIPHHKLFKYGFNLAPMFRRSCGRVHEVSDDIRTVTVRLPLSWKNRNYVGSMFGGSMFSATDPVAMIQLIHLLGEDYVVWDKQSTIRFKRPARETLYATTAFTQSDLDHMRDCVAADGEMDFEMNFPLATKDGTVCAEVNKVIYVAGKVFYKGKRK